MRPPVLLRMHKAMDENVAEEQQNNAAQQQFERRRRKRRRRRHFAMPDVQERVPRDSNEQDEGSEIQKKIGTATTKDEF